MKYRYWIEYVVEIWFLAYIFSTIAFIVCSYLNRNIKNITNTYFKISNVLILNIIIIKIVLFLYQNYQEDIHLKNKYPEYRYEIYHQYILKKIGIGLFSLILTVFLLFKCRVRTIYIILWAFLIGYTENIIIFITSLHRDYIPSSWNYIDLEPFYKKRDFHVLVGTCLHFFVCYFVANSLHQKKVNKSKE